MLNFSLNRAETVSSIMQKRIFNILEGVKLTSFLGSIPRSPFAKRNPYEKYLL